MGVVVDDPLVDDIRNTTTWPRTREGRCTLCNVPKTAHHSDMCPATPIFASMCAKESPSMIVATITTARLGGYGSIIGGVPRRLRA